MTQNGILRWLKTHLDPHLDAVDIWSLILTAARVAALVAGGDVFVRANRGEKAGEDWKTTSSIGVFMGLSALQSGAEIRQFASLRDAAVEMRRLVDDAAKQAELRDQRAAERDRQSAEQQARMFQLNKRMVALAALTLAAAIVTLAVTIAR